MSILENFNDVVERANIECQKLMKKHSVIDRKICDVNHVIELGTFNASQGFKLAKTLQLLLKERRLIKNEYIEVQSIVDNVKNWEKKRPKEKIYQFRELKPALLGFDKMLKNVKIKG